MSKTYKLTQDEVTALADVLFIVGNRLIKLEEKVSQLEKLSKKKSK